MPFETFQQGVRLLNVLNREIRGYPFGGDQFERNVELCTNCCVYSRHRALISSGCESLALYEGHARRGSNLSSVYCICLGGTILFPSMLKRDALWLDLYHVYGAGSSQ